nr:allergen Asp f 7 homolog [Lolium perenne]
MRRRSRSPAPSPPMGVSASRSGSVQGASSPSTPASRSSSPASGRSSSPRSSPPPPAAPVLHPPPTIPPPVAQPPVRRSGRFATTEGGVEATDEDVMQRAMRRKAEKNLDTAGHLQMYRYSPFVVTSSASGEPRPVYGGLYTVGGYGEGYFFPTWVAA